MDIYRQEILDHYKNPHNFGDLSDKTHVAKSANAACGDLVEINLKVVGGVVSDASFRGVGCALSTAAASMLTDKIKGMKLSEVADIGEGEMTNLMGEINPGRVKCVMLPLKALEQAVASKQ